MRKIFLAFAFIFIILSAQGQSQADAAKILQQLKKLNVLGNVLYVAAHPDDENTKLIAYLNNERLVNATYLSLTRGDGGQNLIGPEIREQLGVIRTQELLAARRLDGGKQMFSRANDFGYSKTAEETLATWNKEEVLKDVVWAIRKTQPDVIITRFPPDKRAGHGHHTSSAMLAEEAFHIAGDRKVYPEQLKFVDVWQPKRLLRNTGRWWNEKVSFESDSMISVDIGAYNPLLGQSYSEMAANSRTQHKSQGFGSTGSRGVSEEHLLHVVGDVAKGDFMDGIDLSWNRVGKKSFESKVLSIIKSYDPAAPEKSIPALLVLRNEVESLKSKTWRIKKVAEINGIIKSCSGLYLQAWAKESTITPGQTLPVSIEVTNRSAVNWQLNSIVLGKADTVINRVAGNNNRIMIDMQWHVDELQEYSAPYWLRQPGTLGMYSVEGQENIGLPQNKPVKTAILKMSLGKENLEFELPLIYKWNDRVTGENHRPVNVIPQIMVALETPVNIFTNGNTKSINVKVTAGKDNVTGMVKLKLPNGWKSSPAVQHVELSKKSDEQHVSFSITAPKAQSTGTAEAIAEVDGKVYDQEYVEIAYDHIPYQVLLPKATAKVVNLDIITTAKSIGYIMGSGDQIPESLEQLGISVWQMQESDITSENLDKLDAVVVGIRAYNSNDRLKFYKDVLLDYVKKGGALILQYNTSRGLDWNDFAPYSLEYTGSSASRISEEKATIEILEPKHVVLNSPNKIIDNDFNGWVQERGLYFPIKWDERYHAILSGHDKGETDKDGGLLITQVGEGYFVYTGYAWFRQLPAGVPGAYRLFANIISLGKKTSNSDL